MTYPFDIFKVQLDGSVRWLDAAPDFEFAKARIEGFGKQSPGEFLIYNQSTSKKFLFRAGSNGDGLLPIRLGLDDPLRISLEKILDEAVELSEAHAGNIQLFDPHQKALKIVAHRGFSRGFLDFFDSVSVDDSCSCGAVLRDRKSIVVDDVTSHPIFAEQSVLAKLLSENVRSVQSMPLISAEGEFLGVLSTHYRAAGIPVHRQTAISDDFLAGAVKTIQAANGNGTG